MVHKKPALSKRREKNAWRKYDNGGPYHGKQERRYARRLDRQLEYL